MSRIGVFPKETERSGEHDSSISEISSTYNDEIFCNAVYVILTMNNSLKIIPQQVIGWKVVD
jgi:hypothetical protein